MKITAEVETGDFNKRIVIKDADDGNVIWKGSWTHPQSTLQAVFNNYQFIAPPMSEPTVFVMLDERITLE